MIIFVKVSLCNLFNQRAISNLLLSAIHRSRVSGERNLLTSLLLFFTFSEKFFSNRDDGFGHFVDNSVLRVDPGQGELESRGELESVELETSSLGDTSLDFVDVDNVGSEGDDRGERVAVNVEVRALADSSAELLHGDVNVARGVDVTFLAHGHHGGPGAGDDVTGAGAVETGGGVETAGP